MRVELTTSVLPGKTNTTHSNNNHNNAAGQERTKTKITVKTETIVRRRRRRGKHKPDSVGIAYLVFFYEILVVTIIASFVCILKIGNKVLTTRKHNLLCLSMHLMLGYRFLLLIKLIEPKHHLFGIFVNFKNVNVPICWFLRVRQYLSCTRKLNLD